MATAIINKIIPFSSVDGPGNRTAVFLQGCNFNCRYCHNPETINECVNCLKCVSFCKTGALTAEAGMVRYDSSKCVLCDECIHNCPSLSSPRTCLMDVEAVVQKIKRNMPFIRGITVSGGECTRQRDFLVELLSDCKALGLETLLDSNGSYSFSADKELMAVTDGVMLDIKAWNCGEHVNVTGQGNESVMDNLRFLIESNKLTEVRTVVVPELFDAEETVGKVCETLAGYSRTDIRYKIIKYRENGVRPEYRSLVPPTDNYLDKLKGMAESYGLSDIVII